MKKIYTLFTVSLISASDRWFPSIHTRRGFAIIVSLVLLLSGGLSAGQQGDPLGQSDGGALLTTPGVSADTSICYGDSVLLQITLPGVGPFTLVVSDGTGIDTITGVPFSPVEVYVSPDSTTTYTLISYADATQVFQMVNLSVEVTVHPLPVITIPVQPWGACAITSFFLVGATPDYGEWSGDFVHSWGGGLGIASFFAHQAGAGVHEVLYTWTDSVTGCSNTKGKNVEVFPVPTYQITQSHEICRGDSTMIHISNPSAPVSYSWNTSDTTSYLTISPFNTFTYKVTVTDTQTGCPAWDQVTISVYPKPVVNLGADREVCVDGSININYSIGFADYLWSTGDTSYFIQVDGSSIGLNQTDMFTLTVTNHWGCSGSGSIQVAAVDCTGIDEAEETSQLTVWPNPNDGNFYLKIDGVTGKANIYVTNIAGQMISREQVTLTGEMVKEYNLGHLAPGIYFIRLQSEKAVVTRQVIVK